MSNKSLSWIYIVLDRSGSMESVRMDTIGGCNTFLAEQKKQTQGVLLTLAQFDNEYTVVYDHVALAEVPDLTEATFVPRGSTALLDAIGRTIEAARERIATMPAEFKPSKLLFVIITDGQENASTKFSKGQIAELIGSARAVDKWEFVFVGANLDAFAEARAMNIPVGNSKNYVSDAVGTRLVYEDISRGAACYLAGEDSSTTCFFSEDEGSAPSVMPQAWQPSGAGAPEKRRKSKSSGSSK